MMDIISKITLVIVKAEKITDVHLFVSPVGLAKADQLMGSAIIRPL